MFKKDSVSTLSMILALFLALFTLDANAGSRRCEALFYSLEATVLGGKSTESLLNQIRGNRYGSEIVRFYAVVDLLAPLSPGERVDSTQPVIDATLSSLEGPNRTLGISTADLLTPRTVPNHGLIFVEFRVTIRWFMRELEALASMKQVLKLSMTNSPFILKSFATKLGRPGPGARLPLATERARVSYANLLDEMARLHTTIDRQKKELSDLNDTSDSLRQVLRSKDPKAIKRSGLTLEEIHRWKKAASSTRAALEDQIAAAQDRIQQLLVQKIDALNRLTNLERKQELAVLREDLRKLEIDIEYVELKVGSFKDQRRELKERLRELEEELEDSNDSPMKPLSDMGTKGYSRYIYRRASDIENDLTSTEEAIEVLDARTENLAASLPAMRQQRDVILATLKQD